MQLLPKVIEHESFIEVSEYSLDDQNEYHAWTRLTDVLK